MTFDSNRRLELFFKASGVFVVRLAALESNRSELIKNTKKDVTTQTELNSDLQGKNCGILTEIAVKLDQVEQD